MLRGIVRLRHGRQYGLTAAKATRGILAIALGDDLGGVDVHRCGSGSEGCTHHGTQLPSLARVAQGWANAEEADIGYQEYVLARDGGLIYELYPFFNGPDPEALDRMVSPLS